jgi:tetratricopeptide (TPR) repeat protein
LYVLGGLSGSMRCETLQRTTDCSFNMVRRRNTQRQNPVARKASRQPSQYGKNDGPAAWVVALALAFAICLVYGRALNAPFIFDDKGVILENRSIRSLWPLIGTPDNPGPLSPAADIPTVGRPLVNLSFAVNYYFGDLKPGGYRAVNIGLHFICSMLLWSIVRRTLQLPYFGGKFAASSGWIALTVAMLWSLHPLQTESVAYVTQRTELMVALFYLATLYFSLRYWSAPEEVASNVSAARATRRFGRKTWLIFAVVSCACGMASKEVMVSAPLMVLLFERAFIARSLVGALRNSWPLYLGLACTWLLLFALTLGVPHQVSAGFGLGISAYSWWLTQSKVFLMYLKLALWPWPLLIHYQIPYFVSFGEAWVYTVPVVLIVLAVFYLLLRNHPTGYLGTCMLAILAPTSIVPILYETAAERRMYLPLAAISALFVVVIYALGRVAFQNRLFNASSKLFRGEIAFVVIVVVLFALISSKHLAKYHDEMELWRDVVENQPGNFMAHGHVGHLLRDTGRLPDALDEFRQSYALQPDNQDAVNNYATALTDSGRPKEAIDVLQNYLAKNPDDPTAINNLGIALAGTSRFSDAEKQLRRAIELKPTYAEAHNNLGIILTRTGQIPKAIDEFRIALQGDENYADAHYNLGNVLAASGNSNEAIAHLEKAAGLQPRRADVQKGLGDAYRQAGRLDDAIRQYQLAVRLAPNYMQAYSSLAKSLALANRPQEAIKTAETALAVARSSHQEDTGRGIEEWLRNYQAQLKSAGANAGNSK